MKAMENSNTEKEVAINDLLKQAYQVLNNAPQWKADHKALYEALEQVVVLGAREKAFKDHFDQLEDTVTSALQLDFSKRAPFSQISPPKQNIINYASMTLNMVIEKLETSVVSKKAVNSFISSLPNTAVIITDDKFSIRFINKYIEDLLKTTSEELIGMPLARMLKNMPTIANELQNKNKIDNSPVELLINKEKQVYVKMYMNVPAILDEENEIKEYLFILTKELSDNVDADFDLKLESHDRIAPINQIIAAASYIKTSYTGGDPDINFLASAIEENGKLLKEQAQGTLTSIAQGLPEGYEPINFQLIAEQVIKLIGYANKRNDVEIDIDLKTDNVFFSIHRFIRSIIQNLINNSIKYANPNIKSVVKVKVNDWEDKGVMIIVKDNGLGIPKDKQSLIFDINYQANREAEGHGAGLYLISRIVDKLKGTVTLESTEGAGTTFVVQLPHYK